MFCFEILRIYGENLKKEETGKSGQKRASTSQRREPMPRHRPTPRRGIPCRGKVEVPKMAPLGYVET